MYEQYNSKYADVYFSADSGLEESRMVFLQGNHLAERISSLEPGACLRVAELGFGTGLNFLALVDLIRTLSPAKREIWWYSVDETWIDADRRRALLGAFPELHTLVEHLLQSLVLQVSALDHAPVMAASLDLGESRIELRVQIGDVLSLATILPDKIDAWVLDGHSPALNPAMWSPTVFAMLARFSGDGSSVATYSAAGLVKQGLRSVGFQVLRRPGYGRKRHRLEARFQPASLAQEPCP